LKPFDGAASWAREMGLRKKQHLLSHRLSFVALSQGVWPPVLGVVSGPFARFVVFLFFLLHSFLLFLLFVVGCRFVVVLVLVM
jgi:hypothetical protein